MQSSLLKPEKRLRFSEKHFQGYWVQLNTLIRRNDEADLLLDGLLPNPILTMVEAAEIPVDPNNPNPLHEVLDAIRGLYVTNQLGEPPGTFPPEVADMDRDPLKFIRDFALATEYGTQGGNNSRGRPSVAARRYARNTYAALQSLRTACKHIWEVTVATFSAAEATTIIAGLPYGSGPMLLKQVKSMQQRQTTMALYTLFSQLICLQMKPGERIAQFYGRMLEIRARLANWDPPIVLPDKLIIVCLLRLLPKLFHATRTIIMSKEDMTLIRSKNMLLDVENRDAERVAETLGSGRAAKTTAPTSTALVARTARPDPRNDPRKSEKYFTEGPCDHHGESCGHASSECYVLHPELKKKKKKKKKKKGSGTAAVAAPEAAAAPVATETMGPKPFGFMNDDEDWGYALIGETVQVLMDEVTDILGFMRNDLGYALMYKSDSCSIVQKAIPCSYDNKELETLVNGAQTVIFVRPDTQGMLASLSASAGCPRSNTTATTAVVLPRVFSGGLTVNPQPKPKLQPELHRSNVCVLPSVVALIEYEPNSDISCEPSIPTDEIDGYATIDGIHQIPFTTENSHYRCYITTAALKNFPGAKVSTFAGTFAFLQPEPAKWLGIRDESPYYEHDHPCYSRQVRTTVKATVNTSVLVRPCGKRERHDMYQMYDTDVVLDDVLLYVLPSEVPLIILGVNSNLALKTYCDLYETAMSDSDISEDIHKLNNTYNDEGQTVGHALMMASVTTEPTGTTAERAVQVLQQLIADSRAKNLHASPADATIMGEASAEPNQEPSVGTNQCSSVEQSRHSAVSSKATSRGSNSAKRSKHSHKTHSASSHAKKSSTKSSVKRKKRRRRRGHGWTPKTKTSSKNRSRAAAAEKKTKPPPVSYHNTVHGEVMVNNRPRNVSRAKLLWRKELREGPCRLGPRTRRRMARRGGVSNDLDKVLRRNRLLQPETIRLDVNGPTIKVRSAYEHSPGLRSTLHYPTRCPRHAVTWDEHADRQCVRHLRRQRDQRQYPIHISCVDLHLRIVSRSTPGVPSLKIPGTPLRLEVHRPGHALVTGVEENGDATILDSGATEHLSPNVPGTLQESRVSAIHGLSGNPTPVIGSGKVNNVMNVMCCPGTKRRLLSVGRLLDQLNGKVIFTKTGAYHVNGKVITTLATRDNTGLYKVTNKQYQLDCATGEAMIGTSIATDLARERITLLHRAFGHASKESLRTLIKENNFRGVTENHLQLLQPCNACMLGKAHRVAKNKLSADKAQDFGLRICADCCGPFRTLSVGGAKYLLVVVDEYSGWTWGVPVSTLKTVKDHVATIIEVRLHQRDDTTVKFFRSDGGSEFCNKDMDALLAKHSIERETTCPETSYQNGKAERKIRSIFEKVRTCLSDSGLPPAFWADAAVYVVYTLNRTPSPGGTSPFFKRYGKNPRVSQMRPFGNPCVYYRKRSIAGKIRDAGLPGTFLGYGYINGKKGYRVRVANTNKVITSQDVSFGVFKSAAAQVQLLPPTASATVTNTPASDDHQAEDTPIINEEAVPDQSPTSVTEATPAPDQSVVPVITTPSNAAEISVQPIFAVGDQVEGNWRGHGNYYDAIVTDVHGSGRRITYDLKYTDDGEAEPNVSSFNVRLRHVGSSQGLCGHALVTDCNPAYIAHVPDFASQHVTPKSYQQAMAGTDKIQWLKAILDELKSLKDQGVYVYVKELPAGTKALNSLWVFKVKSGANGIVSRFKARLTVNGKTMVYGIDYNETFAPVAFATTIRLLFAIALIKGLFFCQFDIKCAFLYATLPENERVYMRTPPGFGKRGYLHLRKSLYGLKQSPRLFNEHLHATLTKLRWTSCTFDPCLYKHNDLDAYLVVVVDDMILASPSHQFTEQFYSDMRKVYDIKNLGEPEYVIGVRVKITKQAIMLTQDNYIQELFDKHAPGTKPTNTPAIPSDVLCLTGIHKEKPSPLLEKPKQYRSLVGGLMYALITRPDVATAVSMCARYLAQPRQAHLEAAHRVLRYLHHTRTMSLTYNKSNIDDLSITAFVDSSWANDVDTRRSRYGYAIYVGKSLVSWRSKLHAAIALSTAEAEYLAATEAGKHIKWIISLVKFMVPTADIEPVQVFEDNAACRAMTTSAQVSGRNKHFDLKQHFIRQLAKSGVIMLKPILTLKQIADIFTKALARPAFEAHREILLQGLLDLQSLIDLNPGAATEGGC